MSGDIVVNPSIFFIATAKLFGDEVFESLLDYTLRDL